MSAEVCGCLGCRASAELVIDHDDLGRRVVCPEHAVGYRVVERV
jgi:hypothetical protein